MSSLSGCRRVPLEPRNRRHSNELLGPLSLDDFVQQEGEADPCSAHTQSPVAGAPLRLHASPMLTPMTHFAPEVLSIGQHVCLVSRCQDPGG